MIVLAGDWLAALIEDGLSNGGGCYRLFQVG